LRSIITSTDRSQRYLTFCFFGFVFANQILGVGFRIN
jgi:hypothetical protein